MTVLAAAIGAPVGTLATQGLGGGDDSGGGPVAAVPRESREISEFDGVAGHFAESRALLNFLDQHDDDVVYLEVGFPQHATGPLGGPNVLVEDVPVAGGGTTTKVTHITLVTECPPDVPASDNPTVGRGCMGTSLDIGRPENEDSQTFFEHGVPVIKGYFLVDVTGGLHMGVTPISLKPLTFEQAKGG